MAKKPPKGMMKMDSETVGETGTAKMAKPGAKKPIPKGKMMGKAKAMFRRKTP